MRAPTTCLALCMVLAWMTGEDANAQFDGNQSIPTSYGRRRSNPAMEYFAGQPADQPQPARRQMPLARPVRVARGNKPFDHLNRGSTISPYLSLDLRQSAVSLPNYYAYVRPQLRQQQTNRAQATQLRRLQKQLHTVTTAGASSSNSVGGVPTTGHSSQFLNMGGYYPGAQ